MSRVVLLLFAITAGLQSMTAGAGLATFIGSKPAGLIALLVGALQLGLTTYEGMRKNQNGTTSESG